MAEFLVGDHLVFEGNQSLLHVILWLPVCEHGELVHLDLSVALVHAGQVDFGCEGHLGWLHWVIGAASDCQEVDAVVEVGVGRPNDRAIPLSEGGIIT